MPDCPITHQTCVEAACGEGGCVELASPSLATCPHCQHAILWDPDGTGRCRCDEEEDDEDPDRWLEREN